MTALNNILQKITYIVCKQYIINNWNALSIMKKKEKIFAFFKQMPPGGSIVHDFFEDDFYIYLK